MRKLAMVAAFLAVGAASAFGQEPEFKDLPSVLGKLRECNMLRCRLEERQVWASVRSDGSITIYYDNRRGLDVAASGATVGDAVRNLAAKMNTVGNDAREAVKNIGALLPTQ